VEVQAVASNQSSGEFPVPLDRDMNEVYDFENLIMRERGTTR